MLDAYDISTSDVAWDTEGRLLITSLTTCNQPPLRFKIINAYFPNGTSKALRCSTTGEITGTRHDAKRIFHARLCADIVAAQEAGWHVVLVGDMNVALEAIDAWPGRRMGHEHVRNREDFQRQFLSIGDGDWRKSGVPGLQSMEGVDLWRWLKAAERKYTYHGERSEDWGRSCDRVDLCVVSRSLIETKRIVDMEIWDTVVDRAGSDHVPFSVWLDMM